ncbi:MAG: hypothetical protein ACK4SA_22005, partial [Caldilinea sp.]
MQYKQAVGPSYIPTRHEPLTLEERQQLWALLGDTANAVKAIPYAIVSGPAYAGTGAMNYMWEDAAEVPALMAALLLGPQSPQYPHFRRLSSQLRYTNPVVKYHEDMRNVFNAALDDVTLTGRRNYNNNLYPHPRGSRTMSQLSQIAEEMDRNGPVDRFVARHVIPESTRVADFGLTTLWPIEIADFVGGDRAMNGLTDLWYPMRLMRDLETHPAAPRAILGGQPLLDRYGNIQYSEDGTPIEMYRGQTAMGASVPFYPGTTRPDPSGDGVQFNLAHADSLVDKWIDLKYMGRPEVPPLRHFSRTPLQDLRKWIEKKLSEPKPSVPIPFTGPRRTTRARSQAPSSVPFYPPLYSPLPGGPPPVPVYRSPVPLRQPSHFLLPGESSPVPLRQPLHFPLQDVLPQTLVNPMNKQSALIADANRLFRKCASMGRSNIGAAFYGGDTVSTLEPPRVEASSTFRQPTDPASFGSRAGKTLPNGQQWYLQPQQPMQSPNVTTDPITRLEGAYDFSDPIGRLGGAHDFSELVSAPAIKRPGYAPLEPRVDVSSAFTQPTHPASFGSMADKTLPNGQQWQSQSQLSWIDTLVLNPQLQQIMVDDIQQSIQQQDPLEMG